MIEDHVAQEFASSYAVVSSMGAGNHIRADVKKFEMETVCKIIRLNGFDTPNKNGFLQIQNDTNLYRVHCTHVQFYTICIIHYYKIVTSMSHCISHCLLMLQCRILFLSTFNIAVILPSNMQCCILSLCDTMILSSFQQFCNAMCSLS
jgi:hypothetical protein